MNKIFYLTVALLLVTGCVIPRPEKVQAGEEKKVVEGTVKTFELPKNMRFVQYVRLPASLPDRYIFEEDRPGSGKPPRIVFMELDNLGRWRRIQHLE